jgi:predicted ATPase/class 3 adenylate cyclase
VSKGLDRRLVAVMFTDMVGYTALMQIDERAAIEKRKRYTAALEASHDAGGGTIVQRLGDGSLSMFPNAIDAVQSAIGMQLELGAQDVPVRIGIHLGEVIVEPTGLVGDAVNIASRIESFAVPGSVMVSDLVHDLVQNRPDVTFTSLGRFRLKNVGRPFEIFAASADGIVVPDPRTLAGKGEQFASLPSNLPASMTLLLGRDEDLIALTELVSQHPVVTITGPGGVGKTSAMTELGRRLAPEFQGRVALVPLAEVDTFDGFVPAIAETLDVKEAEGRSLRDGIVALIADKRALLLLDNLEQVVAAAPEVARLTAECPDLRIVTTSRIPLRIAAERVYALAPLPLPPLSGPVDPDSLRSYPSVALFVERARSASPSFELTGRNAAAVTSVCRRLDGLPLALELAAARLRVVPLDALVGRLGKALDVLTSGPRDKPGRHQALRATIEWSHSLLTESEQQLFRRMAVFSGGCTFDDLESVCTDLGGSFLDDLSALVDNALVQRAEVSGRFGMLQTIAEFARDRLEATDEAAKVTLRHACRYAELAGSIRDGIEGDDQIGSVERGMVEEGNLQAALDALLARVRAGDVSAGEAGMQLCGDLWMYWHIRGKNLTAREYATSFLDAAEAEPTVGRAGAFITAGLASWVLGQIERSNEEWSDAHRIATAAGADREVCIAASMLGLGHLGVDNAAGLRWAGEAIERGRTTGFHWAEAFASSFAGLLHATEGDVDAATASLSHAAAVQRRLHDEEGLGVSLGGLAQLALAREDLTGAVDLYRQGLASFEAIGDRAEEARILDELASAQLRIGDVAAARRSFFDSIRAYTDIASVRGIGLSMIGLAACEAVGGHPMNAATIAAAAEGYAAQEGIVNVYSEETPGREFVDRARAELSAADLAEASAIGSSLTIEEALDLARGE